MNIAQQVENLFATTTPAELDKLLLQANFDHFNKVGVDIPSLEQAIKQAEEKRNTFHTALLTGNIDTADRTWSALISAKPVDFGSGMIFDVAYDSLFSWAFKDHEQEKPVAPAGSYEEMPLAA